MKAVVYHEYGSPDVLKIEEVEKPTPKDNEILIHVRATTVSTGDCNARDSVFVPSGFGFIQRLVFGLRKPKKTILGLEFAGDVVAIGKDVTRFKVGDAVFGIDGLNLGAYAEYKCMSETNGVAIKPDTITYQEAASFPNGALTALTFLKNKGKIQDGHKVLINGASGSVGTAAVQLAKYFGAEVTGVCSTTNLALVKSLGADQVIDYTQTDFTQNGQTYDLIFDTVGSTSFAGCRESLTPNGKYLAGAGGILEMGQMAWTAIIGGKKVLGGPGSESREDLEFLTTLLEAGEIKPVIDKQYPLTQTADAHRYVDTGRKKGNVVITVAAQAIGVV